LRALAQVIRWLISQPAVVIANANRVAGSADGALQVVSRTPRQRTKSPLK
jgi:hypothetical protein